MRLHVVAENEESARAAATEEIECYQMNDWGVKWWNEVLSGVPEVSKESASFVLMEYDE
jgi:hypothetical protein